MPNTETLNQDTTAPTGAEVDVNEQTKQSSRRARAKPEASVVATKPASAAPKRPADTKSEIVLKKLRSAKGVSIDQLVQATGWQPHSIRGFLSGTAKKKLGLEVTSESGKDGVRRYRIADVAKAG
jgi:hypothetical protein